MANGTRTLKEARGSEIEGWRAGLGALHDRIAHRFRRSEVRQPVGRYLLGLLGRVDRKNGGSWRNRWESRAPRARKGCPPGLAGMPTRCGTI